LPLGARPLLHADASSQLLIIGQAPGQKAHESGVPWSDRSGDRLRAWLGLEEAEFYDPTITALVPMGFCFPGKSRSGDAAPRAECAPRWHPPLLGALPNVRFTIFVGRYAFERYLGDVFDGLTDAVRAHETLLPARVALPHPSPRNNRWLAKHPWFEREVIPAIRSRVRALVGDSPAAGRDESERENR
jgi:uracil-DNA glycosylase